MSMRDASANRTRVSVASARTRTGAVSGPRSIHPRTSFPSRMPTETKTIAGVIADSVERLDTAAKATTTAAMAASVQLLIGR
jgi:hypothetical protein